MLLPLLLPLHFEVRSCKVNSTWHVVCMYHASEAGYCHKWLDIDIFLCTNYIMLQKLILWMFLKSVFLLDQQRISVLYMGTGKTKKNISKLHGVVSNAILLAHSSNGKCYAVDNDMM